MSFLVYAHFFMNVMISELKEHSILVYQSIYVTSIVVKYLDTSTIKEHLKFHKANLYHDMIFTKEDASSSDQQVDLSSR